MNRSLLTCLLCCMGVLSLPSISLAQQWEIGIFGGVSNYKGDLAPDLALKETHPSFGLEVRQNISGYFAFNYSANYAKISGNDANFSYLAQRNLNFESKILEGSFQVEFNFFKFLGLKAKKFTPYVATGISVFQYDPTTDYNGEKIHLRNVGTEGQGVIPGAPKKYSEYGMAVPITGGFKFKLGDKAKLTIHASYRASFTDYLDDVSGLYPDKDVMIQKKNTTGAMLSDRSGEFSGSYLGYKGRMRGNSTDKDGYMMAGFTFTYVIHDPRCAYKF